jgi:hypothetical protein
MLNYIHRFFHKFRLPPTYGIMGTGNNCIQQKNELIKSTST